MGLWRRAAQVLRGQVPLRPAAQEAGVAGDFPLSREQQLALEDIARRMAEMAVTIKQLEEQARALETTETAETSVAAGAVGSGGSPRAEAQLQMIDEMLSGIRQLRSALDQQRGELAEAEQRLVDGGPETPPG